VRYIVAPNGYSEGVKKKKNNNEGSEKTRPARNV
jgi:hypothetical protein